jgi:hypothetical protein
MTKIKPFSALRPQVNLAREVASRPYDVLNSKEAKDETRGNPNSFLHVTKSEIDLPENTDIHSQVVYDKARENFHAFIQRGILFREDKPCYYLYRLGMQGRFQTGLVCLSSVDDYEQDLIKKHEFTRPEKELDRINHMKTIGAQTGNVFLACRNVADLDDLINKWTSKKMPQYDFTAEDGITHSIWIVNDDDTIQKITSIFENQIPCTYIADGHHRAASAAKVRQTMKNNPHADHFLTTIFPASEVKIFDYNRVVKDLNGFNEESLLEKAKAFFDIEKMDVAYRPDKPHRFGLYINKHWYKLEAREGSFSKDPLGVLDVSILQANFLDPLLNIKDQRTDKRIDFVGGIRGLEELEKRVDSGDMALAISLYPVSIEQLFDISDAGQVMPPKSTWFEPKLRDGLLTNIIE